MYEWRIGHQLDGRISYLETSFKSSEEAKQHYKQIYNLDFDAQTYEHGNFFFLEKNEVSFKGIFLSLATCVVPTPKIRLESVPQSTTRCCSKE